MSQTVLTRFPPQIYLASASPRRRELLTQIGVCFELLPNDIDESQQPGETPRDMVVRLAVAKAQQAWHLPQRRTEHPVLGADTLVVLENQILGKPKDKQEGCAMLHALSGCTHEVFTAVALVQGDRIEKTLSASRVSMATLSQQQIDTYWALECPLDKAGAYGIQGRAALFIQRIEGSYSGIMGLPLYETGQLLRSFAVKLMTTGECR